MVKRKASKAKLKSVSLKFPWMNLSWESDESELKVPRSERKIIGEDIKTVQFGWPMGMPLVRKVDVSLWEVRTKIDNRISRVIFTVYGEFIVLIHGFIKKSQKIPIKDLTLAKKRLSNLKGNL